MRFMMMIYPGEKAENGTLPDPSMFEAMLKYNQELQQAGVLISLDGLQPTAKGARVTFTGGKATVTDGPFTETKEVIGGYWMIRVNSRDEAIAWATRVPCAEDEVIELRQIYDLGDFPEEAVSPDLLAREKELGEKLPDQPW
ncbi:MAG TPA: YciI family protein [Thermomicrobiales bacterium]|nr:YciI family protein [Thermomicrobiales bacterium]